MMDQNKLELITEKNKLKKNVEKLNLKQLDYQTEIKVFLGSKKKTV